MLLNWSIKNTGNKSSVKNVKLTDGNINGTNTDEKKVN